MSEQKAWVCVVSAFAAVVITLISWMNFYDIIESKQITVREQSAEVTRQIAIKAGLCQIPTTGNALLRWDTCEKK